MVKDNSHKDMATDNVLDEEMKTMSKHDSSEFRSFKQFDSLRDNSSMFNTNYKPTFT